LSTWVADLHNTKAENSIEETIQDMSALVIADLAKLPHIF
jgi:hypothetical protein